MRFESKHLFFTSIAKNTNNFVNIAKTMAKRHQAIMAYKPFSLSQIVPPKTVTKFINTSTFAIYKDEVAKFYENDLRVLKFATFNSFQYREGLMIIVENIFHEIVHVFFSQSKISFFCRRYKSVRLDPFLNSVEVILENNSPSFILVNPENLRNKKSYEKKHVVNKSYIVCDTLCVGQTIQTL